MNKKKITLVSLVIIIVTITIGMVCIKDRETVKFTQEDVYNEKAWNEFKVTTGEGNIAKINLVVDISGDKKATLEYDGDRYIYTCGDNIEKAEYLIDVTGRIPNAASDSRFIVLSDFPYTFEQISVSTYTNDSEKMVPFYMIYGM